MAIGAQAQVIRCTDPATGKVSYTDGKCASGTQGQEIEARKSPEQIQAEREQAAEAVARRRERLMLEAEQARVDERQLRESQRAEQPAAQRSLPDPAQSQACMQARRQLEEVQSTLGRGMYDEAQRLDQANRQVDQACLTPDQWARAQRDRAQIYDQGGYTPYVIQPPYVVRPPRPPRPPHPPVHPQPPKPPVFTNCNVFRCTDAAGNVYPR